MLRTFVTCMTKLRRIVHINYNQAAKQFEEGKREGGGRINSKKKYKREKTTLGTADCARGHFEQFVLK